MSLSAKWTAVSLFAVTALCAGSVAFAGCTVTNGPITDTEGGVTTPIDQDSSTGDSATGTDAGNACPGNTKQTAVLVSAACQAALETECCTELTGCFGLDVPAAQDCNVYSACIADCKKPVDGGTPTDTEIQQCQTDLCDSNSPKNVQDAYDAIITCASKAGSQSVTVCQ